MGVIDDVSRSSAESVSSEASIDISMDDEESIRASVEVDERDDDEDDEDVVKASLFVEALVGSYGVVYVVVGVDEDDEVGGALGPQQPFAQQDAGFEGSCRCCCCCC